MSKKVKAICPHVKKPCIEEKCLGYEETITSHPSRKKGFFVIRKGTTESHETEWWEEHIEKTTVRAYTCLALSGKLLWHEKQVEPHSPCWVITNYKEGGEAQHPVLYVDKSASREEIIATIKEAEG